MTEDLTADVGLHKITFQVYPTSSRYAICSFIIAICWGAQQLIGYEGSNLIDNLAETRLHLLRAPWPRHTCKFLKNLLILFRWCKFQAGIWLGIHRVRKLSSTPSCTENKYLPWVGFVDSSNLFISNGQDFKALPNVLHFK